MRDPRIDPQPGDILRKNGGMVLVDAAFEDSVHVYPLDDDVPLLLAGAEVVRVGWPEDEAL